ncbi:MAG: ABC transporter permease [Spirochaetales bacterium]
MLASIAFLIGQTMMYSSPLIFTSLGGTMSENSGVINIGLEGMMVVGAFTAAAAGYFSGNPWIGFMAGGVMAGFFGLLHAVACVTFNADHVVSGIAINFLGPGFSYFVSRLLFDGATQTRSLGLENKIPRPLNGLFGTNSFFELLLNRYATAYIALIMVVAVWFLLYRTRLGLRMRAVGQHPEAADTLGVHVRKVRYFSVIASGVLAGFGGATLSIAIISQFRPGLISGQGFIALAAMIFGKWKPQGALLACLLFGFAQAMVVFLGLRTAAIPTQIMSMLPYVLTLVVLVGFVGKSVAPRAVGKPFGNDA